MGGGKMVRPAKVYYKTEEEYFEHYKRVYCREKVFTFDGIRVFFDPKRFFHAFYELDKTKLYGGHKSKFCFVRAKRIDWIKNVLESENSILYKGYNKNVGYISDRRVAVISDDKYVVVLNMFFNSDNELCAKFNTAYCANKSYNTIISGMLWDRKECENCLKNKKGS